MSGPPKKPSQLKKLQGTYRKDRAAPREMEPPKCNHIPNAPAHMERDAARVWRKVCKTLFDLDMLYKVDFEQLELYCYLYARAKKAEAQIREMGEVITEKNVYGHDKHVKNPWLSIQKECIVECNKIAQQFGLTPSARTRVSMPKDKKSTNPLEALMQRASS